MKECNTRRGQTQKDVVVGQALPDNVWLQTSSSPSRGKAECVSTGMRGLARGFTLMEILVVVLIIGVLAAIAVPQYQRSALKSKFTSVIPPTKTIADAQEFYYLNHGEYAEETNELDITPQQNSQTDIVLSDMKNYKFVMGTHTGVPGASYIVYQAHSKRFADNIHCEAAKDNAMANWLCETGMGGTLLTGSLGGSDYLTYLISGNPGTDKFLREDCPEGSYDQGGRCVLSSYGSYAEDGEMKPCAPGTYQPHSGQTDCIPCPVGMRQPYEGTWFCYECHSGFYSDMEGSASCKECPAGTYSSSGATSCTPCPAGKYTAYGHQSQCDQCQTGYYTENEGSKSCKKCPNGTTNNEDHTGCVSI